MKTLEFDSTISESGDITLPPEIASEIPLGHPLRVVVMWDSGADPAWRATTRRAFESAYAPEDEVYEQLIDDASVR